MNDQQLRHVFISYVRENKKQVDRLCKSLEEHGVNVWLDRNSIKPGARWKNAIREAIRYGDFFIACFSDAYTSKAKTYMNEELILAVEELRQYASDREWFIPVLLSECDVPARSIGVGETLLDINWVPLHEDWDVGIQRILSVIKPISPEIQNLLHALHSKDDAVCRQAAEALRGIGSEAVPALVEALKDENGDVRWRAGLTLEKIGPGAVGAVPALTEALKDDDIYVRLQAALALGKIGSGAVGAVPALAKDLEDDDVGVRRQAEIALGKIDTPEARKALEEYKNKSG